MSQDLSPQIEQIRSLIRDGEFEDALENLNQIREELPIEMDDLELRCILDLLEINILNELRNYDEALSKEEEILKIIDKIQNWEIKCDYFGQCALTSLAFEGLDTANTHIKQSETWINAVQPPRYGDKKDREAMIAKIKGIIATIQGNNQAAQTYYFDALKRFKEKNNIRESITLYNDLGESFRLTGNLQKAEELYKEGLELAKINGLSKTFPYYYNNLGEVHRLKGDLSSALKYYEQALVASDENLDEKYFCIDFSSIGQIYWEKGEVEKATQFLEDNLIKCENMGSFVNACQILFILFRIQLDQNHIQHATEYYERFTKLAEKVDVESVHLRIKLAKALLLKTNLRSRNRIASEDLLGEILQNQNTDNEMRILALLNLCELLLIEFQFVKDLLILQEIQTYIDQLNKYTMKQHSYWLLAELYLVRAKLALAKVNLTEARRFLTQAQYIADEHGFSQLAIRISLEHDRVLQQIPLWSQFQDADISVAQRIENNQALSLPPIGENEDKDENPMLFTIIKEEGTALFSYPFTPEWGFDENLFSGFLTAFNQFSGELFSESLDRANFGKYTILMEKLQGFTFCYVFKGPTYRAQKKFNHFLANLPKETSLWNRLLEGQSQPELLTISRIPGMEKILMESFRQNLKNLGQK